MDARTLSTSFVPECKDWIELRGSARGEERGR
jgi:hypothetical protein